MLGRVPWDPIDAPIASFAARDEPHWLTRFTGGWPLLFPNGGDACDFGGIFHGFHGEASISPWDVSLEANAISSDATLLQRSGRDAARTDRSRATCLIVRERLRMNGARPVEVMWGHHATFGSDLLAGPFEITTGARRVTVDRGYDPPANPLTLGAEGAWPMVAGKSGRGRPVEARGTASGVGLSA